MKFKNKKTGVIVEAKNMYEENILKGNPNYTVFKDVEVKEEKAGDIEENPQKPAKKGGK